jgi:hypothetical protein
MKSDIKKLALSGLLGGALALGGVACGKGDDKKPAADKTQTPETQTPKTQTPKTQTPNTQAPKTVVASKYSEIHSCKGQNSCRGLGGCAVAEEKLAELAQAVGVPADKAGSAHSCAGQNECKGLGGCKVDEDRLATLKEKLQAGK